MHTYDIKMKEEPTIETHLSVTQVVKDTSWSHASTPLNTALTCTEPTGAKASKWYLNLLLQLTTNFSFERDPKNW